jgi:hypothetical protein
VEVGNNLPLLIGPQGERIDKIRRMFPDVSISSNVEEGIIHIYGTEDEMAHVESLIKEMQNVSF